VTCAAAETTEATTPAQSASTNLVSQAYERSLQKYTTLLTTKYGVLRGIKRPLYPRVRQFLGVPYVTPPRRFCKATPLRPWRGVRDATSVPARCRQLAILLKQSDDCLY